METFRIRHQSDLTMSWEEKTNQFIFVGRAVLRPTTGGGAIPLGFPKTADILPTQLLTQPYLKIGISFAFNFRFSFDFCKFLVYLGFEDRRRCPKRRSM
jgi:hypothetical protein